MRRRGRFRVGWHGRPRRTPLGTAVYIGGGPNAHTVHRRSQHHGPPRHKQSMAMLVISDEAQDSAQCHRPEEEASRRDWPECLPSQGKTRAGYDLRRGRRVSSSPWSVLSNISRQKLPPPDTSESAHCPANSVDFHPICLSCCFYVLADILGSSHSLFIENNC